MRNFRASETLLSLSLLVSLLGVSGCATAGGAGLNSYQFMDRKGEVRIVEKDNDLYLETFDVKTNDFDPSKSRRITFTPKDYEMSAHFSKNGKYILYAVEKRGW